MDEDQEEIEIVAKKSQGILNRAEIDIAAKEWRREKALRKQLTEDKLNELKKALHRNALSVMTVSGFLVGVALGFSLKFSPTFGTGFWTARRASLIAWPGEIYFNMLRCVSVPLFITSVVAAIGSMSVRTFSFLIWRTILYISVTSIATAAIGIGLTLALHPGRQKDHPVHVICLSRLNDSLGNPIARCTQDGHPCLSSDYRQDDVSHSIWFDQETLGNKTLPQTGPFCGNEFHITGCNLAIDKTLDLIRTFFPENALLAYFRGSHTVINLRVPNNRKSPAYRSCAEYTLAPLPKPDLVNFRIFMTTTIGPDMRGLFVFFIVLGLAALVTEELGRPALDLFTSFSECLLKISTWIMWLSPVGVCSSSAAYVLSKPSYRFPTTVYSFLFTCLLGLVIYALVLLPVIYVMLVRKSPFKFYRQLIPLLCLTFGTPFSGSTVPVTIHILEEVCEIDPRIVRLTTPIFSQINSCGFTLTTAMATVYVAQLHGVEITWWQAVKASLMIFVGITIAPTDLHNIRESTMARLQVALNSIDLPGEFAVYVSPFELTILAAATVANVLSDCVLVAIVAHWGKQPLHKITLQQQQSKTNADSVLDINNDVRAYQRSASAKSLSQQINSMDSSKSPTSGIKSDTNLDLPHRNIRVSFSNAKPAKEIPAVRQDTSRKNKSKPSGSSSPRPSPSPVLKKSKKSTPSKEHLKRRQSPPVKAKSPILNQEKAQEKEQEKEAKEREIVAVRRSVGNLPSTTPTPTVQKKSTFSSTSVKRKRTHSTESATAGTGTRTSSRSLTPSRVTPARSPSSTLVKNVPASTRIQPEARRKASVAKKAIPWR